MDEPQDSRSQLERMVAGDLYLADDPEIIRAARRARELQERYNRHDPLDQEGLGQILRELLGAVGPGCEVRPPFHVDFGEFIHLGARVFANFGLVALDVATITIGDDTQIGPDVQLLTPTHPLEPDLRRAKWEAAAPIAIGSNVWLGGGATVLPGVTIGDDAVVGAGAVVTRDVDPRTVVAGNPARTIRSGSDGRTRTR